MQQRGAEMLVYGLSAQDEITFTGSGWDGYALAHGGAAALSQRIVGRPLWDFVSGDAARRFYRDHFRSCRLSGEAFTVIFRHDSGSEERLFCQRIVPAADGSLRLEARLVRSHPLPPVQPVTLACGQDMQRCSICMAGSTDGRWWIEAARLGTPDCARATWAICPDCRAGAVNRCPDGGLRPA